MRLPWGGIRWSPTARTPPTRASSPPSRRGSSAASRATAMIAPHVATPAAAMTAAAETEVRPPSFELGAGIGWRPEIAASVERRRDLGFVEVIAENIPLRAPLPPSLERLRARGVAIIAHGVSLSLGGAEPPSDARITHLAGVAERLGSPLVSEHCCFVRSGGFESGHLIALPRTRETLAIVVDNL